MRSHLINIAVLFVLCGLCGCLSHHPTTAMPKTTAGKQSVDLAIRNSSLALLNDLLSDEKNLSKILLIKFESRELNRVVKDISEAAANGVKLLESVAKEDPSLDLKNIGLPPGEQATREAIAKTKRHLLLHSHGIEFEFQILLTQVQALSYGAHLALVVAENEPQSVRAREFSELSGQLNQLNERVLTMVRTNKWGGLEERR